MGAKIDLRGRKFGRLMPMDSFWDRKMECTRWVCRCDCGDVVKVRMGDLMSGGTMSCGCLRADQNRAHFKSLAASRAAQRAS